MYQNVSWISFTLSLYYPLPKHHPQSRFYLNMCWPDSSLSSTWECSLNLTPITLYHSPTYSPASCETALKETVLRNDILFTTKIIGFYSVLITKFDGLNWVFTLFGLTVVLNIWLPWFLETYSLIGFWCTSEGLSHSLFDSSFLLFLLELLVWHTSLTSPLLSRKEGSSIFIHLSDCFLGMIHRRQVTRSKSVSIFLYFITVIFIFPL